MEATQATPQLLISAAPAQPGMPGTAGARPQEALRPTPASPPDKAPAAAEKTSEFSRTINDLKARAEPRQAAPASPAAPTGSPAAPPPAPATEALSALLRGEPAPLPATDGDLLPATGPGEALPESGKLLPAPEIPGAALETPVAEATTPPPAATLAPPLPVPTDARAPAEAPAPAADAALNRLTPAPAMPAAASTDNGGTLRASASTAQPATPLAPTGAASSETTDSTGQQDAQTTSQQGDQALRSLRDLLLQAGANPRSGAPIQVDGPVGAGPQPAPVLAPQSTALPPGSFAATLATAAGGEGPALQPNGNSDAFAQGLGERLALMANNGTQTARIRLHPENLGPLDIRVQVEDDTARVFFNVQHAQTRDALEQAMPRLREMFAEQGLQLARSEVGGGDRSGGDPSGGAEPGAFDGGWSSADEESSQPLPQSLLPLAGGGSRRLLDVTA